MAATVAEYGAQSRRAGPGNGVYDGMAGVTTGPERGGDIGSGVAGAREGRTEAEQGRAGQSRARRRLKLQRSGWSSRLVDLGGETSKVGRYSDRV